MTVCPALCNVFAYVEPGFPRLHISRGSLRAVCIGLRGGVVRGALELVGGSLEARTSATAVSADARDFGGRGCDADRRCF